MDNRIPIFRSIAMIEERIQEKLTVENLASSIHFSKYHYQRMFREAVGDSVMRYVTRRRLLLAAGELARTDEQILAIALKYGFESHEVFTRNFSAYMGVSPTKYRKYHISIGIPGMRKEKDTMIDSKTTDEMIRELNRLIVQAKETAAYTRKEKVPDPEAASFYAAFWDFAADRIEEKAEKLTKTLRQITGMSQRPDGISARFMMIKAVEDIAFGLNVIAFQVKLTIARAKQEHRALFAALCEKYDALARNASVGAGKIAAFFHELSALIFKDMREQAGEKLAKAVERGKEAAALLSKDPSLPYAYLADEIRMIAEQLAGTLLEDVTVERLEDYLFMLDIISCAAGTDALRAPEHEPLFAGICAFQKQLEETARFFGDLSDDMRLMSAKAQEESAAPSAEKQIDDMAFMGNVLLFYLRGEVQKLRPCLEEGQKDALNRLCGRMDRAVGFLCDRNRQIAADEMAQEFQEVYKDVCKEAENLGTYGNPLRFIGEEIGHMTEHMQKCI